MRAVISILVLASVAAADPKAPVCIPPDQRLSLQVRDGKAIACTHDGACWSITRDGTVTSASQPAPIPDAPTTARIDDKGVCLGTVCKPAGKSVLAAAVALRTVVVGGGTPIEQRLHVTPDHEVVIIKGKAFKIAPDKPLAMTAPSEYVKLRYPPIKKPKLLRTEGIGNILLATWECAGSTTCDSDVRMAVAVDTKGKTQSSWFPAGKAIALDDDRLIVMGNEQTAVTSLSPATGKLIGAYTISDGNIVGRAAKVDADTVVVLTHAGGYDLYWVGVPKDKPPSKLSRQALPLCPRAKP